MAKAQAARYRQALFVLHQPNLASNCPDVLQAGPSCRGADTTGNTASPALT